MTVGPVAHGGHCVARHEGRVVFVRHTLPGRAGRRPGHRGPPPRASAGPTPSRCSRPRRTGSSGRARTAGPGRCGGCDWQHVAPAGAAGAQGGRRPRAAGPAGRTDDVDVTVEELPGGRCAGAPGRASPSTGPGRPGCAGTGRTTSSSSTTARSPWRPPRGRCWGSAGPGPGAVDVSVDSTGAVTTTRLDRRGHPTSTRVVRPGGDLPEEPPAGPSGAPAAATGRSRAPASGRSTRRPPTRWSAPCAGFAEVRPGETVSTSTRGSGCSGARSRPRPAPTGGSCAWSPTRRPARPPTRTSPTCRRPRSGRARSTPRGWPSC